MKFLAPIFCALAITFTNVFAAVKAKVDAEIEGFEIETQGNGTFLIGGPTYYFDRILGAGGMHSESELWTPQKLRHRYLFNRLSYLPSWAPFEPSIWLKTGNELGDMIYNNFYETGATTPNRTPILEGGIRTPSFKGFWVTARMFQDDHFSVNSLPTRNSWITDEFAIFGENQPLFSTLYAGAGFENDFINASIIAGEEYLWVYSMSSRWLPLHYKPRIESRVDVSDFHFTLVYEDVETSNKSKKENGARKEWNGSIYYENAKLAFLELAAGLAFRAVEDSGTFYTHLEDNQVLWPFIELKANPHKNIRAAVTFGINQNDFLVEDSVEFSLPLPEKLSLDLGVKNISGSRLNPLADTEEYINGDTISLTTSGAMNLILGYVRFADTLGQFSWGARGSYWTEHGAETFDTTSIETKSYSGNLFYRHGDVSRINSWLHGITGELWLGIDWDNFFDFKAMVGAERIFGDDNLAEVSPAEFYTSFEANWLLKKSFRISHAIHYRSDARWNLRSPDPFVIKGDWFWDVTFEQRFLNHGIYLTGTLLHVLADEIIETPNGNENRLRFICQIKKVF